MCAAIGRASGRRISWQPLYRHIQVRLEVTRPDARPMAAHIPTLLGNRAFLKYHRGRDGGVRMFVPTSTSRFAVSISSPYMWNRAFAKYYKYHTLEAI